jgi:gliding motility-associated-like protein
VAVVGAEIVFTQDPYMLCEGAVTVSFNNADFQTWQWLDNSIKKNTITNSGTYELQAFDWNGCLISKRISVLSPPKVNLGRDTMICTPGFRLHALKHNTNPEATVYTWSTGESGALPYLDVPDHATGQDVPYWVRADFGGCSVSDTVLVLACAQTYENPFQMMIPNTFTPNGDGDNDVWQIRALKDYPNVVVEVYDRWGRRVFIGAKGYPTPWDGRDMDGKTLPLETYYYIVNLNNGIQTKPILGTITIVR